MFIGFLQLFAITAAPECLVRYTVLKKKKTKKKTIVFHKIFLVGACPNLKDSSFYGTFSVNMHQT